VLDGEKLDLDEGSFDAVICRFGLMLFSDPPKALRGMGRVVRPDGKVAVLVFSAAEKNPYEGVPRTVAHRRGKRMPRLFVLGEQRLLEDTFRNSGFSTVYVHVVATHRHFSSTTEAIRKLHDDFHGRSIIELPETEREQAWEEVEQQLRRFEGPNGCELPGELLIGVGTK
jgi:SAM-dependent methyltransferase